MEQIKTDSKELSRGFVHEKNILLIVMTMIAASILFGCANMKDTLNPFHGEDK